MEISYHIQEIIKKEVQYFYIKKKIKKEYII